MNKRTRGTSFVPGYPDRTNTTTKIMMTKWKPSAKLMKFYHLQAQIPNQSQYDKAKI